MDRRLFLMRAAAGLLASPHPARALPTVPVPRRLKLHNAHTGENFDGAYRDEKGPIAPVMDELSVFFRDFHSGARTRMDVEVLDFLAAVMDAVGETKATVLSAYRTPETNAMLARTTFGVADNSQHLYGRAIDVTFPSRLADAMEAARRMQRGGVGWYPQSHFIHLDSGPVRNWNLEGRGFDNMVVDLRRLVAQLRISPRGEIVSGAAHRPLTVKQRLALHRMIAHAERLARGS